MPRKQTRQPSRKRLWFNVVEFDKETGRPLWRNKKSKLENTLPPCMMDQKFTALIDKLRKETAENARIHETMKSATPYLPAWRVDKYHLNPRAEFETPGLLQGNSFGKSCYEEAAPKLVMQFQHFSPLEESAESLDEVNLERKERQIKDLHKMKSVQSSGTYQPFHAEKSHVGRARDGSIKRDAAPCGMTSTFGLPSEWGMNNTVRLHHLDLENPPNYGLTVNQQVALTIY